MLGRLDVLRLRVAAVVAARRAVDTSPDDPFLGLYLSDERIDELLRNDRVWVDADVAAEQAAAVERDADAAAADGAELRAPRRSPAGSASTTSTSTSSSRRWRPTSTTASSATTATSTTT